MSNATTHSSVVYVLPEAKMHHARWDACESRNFVPDEQQLIVIGAVQNALTAGCFYSSDVREHCSLSLGLSAEQIEANFNLTRVEGGIFGMECYYARKYLEAKGVHAAEDAAADQLKATVGLKLGKLTFGDLRKCSAAEIKGVDGSSVSVEVKIGRNTAIWSTTALAIKNAMNRAVEYGRRKDGFEQFCAAR